MTPEPRLLRLISDLADSATRGATGRTKGIAEEMAIINPACNEARGLVVVLAERVSTLEDNWAKLPEFIESVRVMGRSDLIDAIEDETVLDTFDQMIDHIQGRAAALAGLGADPATRETNDHA